jgi:hypothetical protein
MNKAEISDLLDRTYEMEETMVGMLVGLCHPEALDTEIPQDIREKIRGILLGIKEDSLRHKKMVLEIKNGLK